jgi:hypothetical protein
MVWALKDAVLYILAILAALIIAFIIYLLAKATLEFITAFFVNLSKSQEWCKKVENAFEINQKEISELKEFRRIDNKERVRLGNNLDVIYRELKELRDFTGIDAIKAQADAEKAIEESVQ